MTLAAWRKEFLPVSPQTAARQGKDSVWAQTMLKLEGIKSRNLKRHGLVFDRENCLIEERLDGDEDYVDESIDVFDPGACAFCSLYSSMDCKGADEEPCPVFSCGGGCGDQGSLLDRCLFPTRDFRPARAFMRRLWKQWFPRRVQPKTIAQLTKMLRKGGKK